MEPAPKMPAVDTIQAEIMKPIRSGTAAHDHNPDRIELRRIFNKPSYLCSSPGSPGSSFPFFTTECIRAMSPSSKPAAMHVHILMVGSKGEG